jgi:hypothetical protein
MQIPQQNGHNCVEVALCEALSFFGIEPSQKHLDELREEVEQSGEGLHLTRAYHHAKKLLSGIDIGVIGAEEEVSQLDGCQIVQLPTDDWECLITGTNGHATFLAEDATLNFSGWVIFMRKTSA